MNKIKLIFIYGNNIEYIKHWVSNNHLSENLQILDLSNTYPCYGGCINTRENEKTQPKPYDSIYIMNDNYLGPSSCLNIVKYVDFVNKLNNNTNFITIYIPVEPDRNKTPNEHLPNILINKLHLSSYKHETNVVSLFY